jgi:hypothetical protein
MCCNNQGSFPDAEIAEGMHDQWGGTIMSQGLKSIMIAVFLNGQRKLRMYPIYMVQHQSNSVESSAFAHWAVGCHAITHLLSICGEHFITRLLYQKDCKCTEGGSLYNNWNYFMAPRLKTLDQLQLVPSGGDTGHRRDQPGTKMFSHLHPGPQCPEIKCMEPRSQFLRPATIRTWQILLGFYPSIQITSQFMSHDWELLVCIESQLWSEYFSRSYCKFGQNNAAGNDEAIFSICHIWSRDIIDDCVAQ